VTAFYTNVFVDKKWSQAVTFHCVVILTRIRYRIAIGVQFSVCFDQGYIHLREKCHKFLFLCGFGAKSMFELVSLSKPFLSYPKTCNSLPVKMHFGGFMMDFVFIFCPIEVEFIF